MEQPWLIIVLLGLVIIVYARINKSDNQPLQKKIIEEMEDTFDHFAMEIEEENKQLVGHVVKLKQQNEEQTSKLLSRIEYLEKQFMDTAIQYKSAIEKSAAEATLPLATSEIQKKPNKEEAHDEMKKVPDQPLSLEIKDRYQDLFQLHNQGKSIEYISKKLTMNKGEVQLILQLAKQEEQSGV